MCHSTMQQPHCTQPEAVNTLSEAIQAFVYEPFSHGLNVIPLSKDVAQNCRLTLVIGMY